MTTPRIGQTIPPQTGSDEEIPLVYIPELEADKISTGTLSAATITVGDDGIIQAGTNGTKVQLTKDGLRILKDSTEVFRASGGNLYVKGTIEATDGVFTGTVSAASIVGSVITGTVISGTTITGSVVSGTAISGGSISLGGGRFTVSEAGAMNATGATISGMIKTAQTGQRTEISHDAGIDGGLIAFRSDNALENQPATIMSQSIPQGTLGFLKTLDLSSGRAGTTGTLAAGLSLASYLKSDGVTKTCDAQLSASTVDIYAGGPDPTSTMAAMNITTLAKIRLGAAKGVYIDYTVDASPTSTDHPFQIGAYDAQNLIIDNNEIISRNNGVAQDLYLGANASVTVPPHVSAGQAVQHDDTGWVSAVTPAAPLTGTVMYRRINNDMIELAIDVAWTGSWNATFTVGTLTTAARPSAATEYISGWWNAFVPGFARLLSNGTLTIEQAAATSRTSFVARKVYLSV